MTSELGPRSRHDLWVIGGGLAGSEAAWQAAKGGLRVVLVEMRPAQMTPVHETALLAELVCSNSLGSDLPDRALGILKAELRRAGSLILQCADRTSVPAGGALAVGREAFSSAVTSAIADSPNITLLRSEVREIPGDRPVIIATGPLTSPTLSQSIRALAGRDHLHFFDAMAPIVSAESIDMTIAFRASRYRQREGEGPGDYINCPFDRESYERFVAELRAAAISQSESEAAVPEDEMEFFEACLPIEVMARRSPQALAFGPMRPVGLRDPRTGHRPFAVVQLRQDNVADTLYNLVGFQTSLKWGDQERILRLIPGLEAAEFVRFGQMHRNTFIDTPTLLRPTLQWHARDDLLFAGQIIGTEGYVGSTASGLLAGMNAARYISCTAPTTPPPTTMLGGLIRYVTTAESATFQPMKANMALLEPLENPVRDKRARNANYAERSRNEITRWLTEVGAPSA